MAAIQDFIASLASVIHNTSEDKKKKKKEEEKNRRVFRQEEFLPKTSPAPNLSQRTSSSAQLRSGTGPAEKLGGKARDFLDTIATQTDTALNRGYEAARKPIESGIKKGRQIAKDTGAERIITKIGEQEAIRTASPFGVPKEVRDVKVRDVAKFAGDLAESTARAIPRASIQLAQTATGITETKPKPGWQQFVYGKEPIRSLEESKKHTSEDIQKFGKEKGLPIRKEVADPLAAAASVGGLALDLIPPTSGKKGVAKELAGKVAKKLDQSEDILRPNIKTSAGGTDVPSSVLATNSPSSSVTTTRMSPSITYSPTASVGDIVSSKSFIDKYNSTTAEKPFLDDLLSSVAGDRSHITNIKDKTIAAEKIVRKLKSKPAYSEENLGDLLRGNVIANDTTDANNMLQQLSQKVKVESVDDFINRPSQWGYQGMNVNVRTPNGNLAEVQIHTPQSVEIQKALHPLYEKYRNADSIPVEAYAESKRIADEVTQRFSQKGATNTVTQAAKVGESGTIPVVSPDRPGGGSIPGVPDNVDQDIIYDQGGSGKIKKVSGKNQFEYDLKSLATPEEVKNVILGSVRQGEAKVQEQRRGTISFTQMRTMADQLGMSTEEVMKRKPGKIWNAEQADAANRLMLGANEEVFESGQLIADLQKAGKEVPEELKMKHAERVMRSVGITASVIGDRSEAGRALNAAKAMKEAITDPTSKGVATAIKMFGGDEKKAKAVIERLATFDPEDRVGMVKFLRSVKPSTPMDKIEELWYNSILSNTATHIVNQTGNIMATSLKVPEKIVAGTIDAAITGTAKLFGKDLERSRYAAEAAAEINGARTGFANGFRRAAHVLKEGFSEMDATKLDVGRGQAIKTPIIGDIINTPSRMLVAGDELWKGVNYQMELTAQAVRAAKKAGATGAEYNAKVADLIANPTAQMIEEATEVAKYRVFQGDSRSAEAVRHFRDNVAVLNLARLGGEFRPLRFILPFIQTPTNVVKFGLEHSPVGFVGTTTKIAQGADKGDIADSAARAFIGSTIMVPLAMYATEGRITGKAPSDKQEKDAFYADGKLPFSIKIGDRWWSYNRVEPFNTVLSQIALWHDSFKDNDQIVSQETISEFLRGMAENLGDQTFMTGLGNLMDAVEDPDRYGQKFLTDIIGGFIPSLAAAGARTIDETVRQPKTFVESLQARIPGQSQNVPGRESEFEPGGIAKRHTNDTLATNLLSQFGGFRSTPDSGSNVLPELREIKRMRREAKAESEQSKVDASALVDELKDTPAEKRGEVISRYEKEGKLTEKTMKNVESALKEQALPLVGEERSLKNSSNAVRAEYMYEKLKELPKEERGAWIDNMVEKKIVTEDVIDRFIELSKKKKERPPEELPTMNR